MKTCFNCGDKFEGNGDICEGCQRELAKPENPSVDRFTLICARAFVLIMGVCMFVPYVAWMLGVL